MKQLYLSVLTMTVSFSLSLGPVVVSANTTKAVEKQKQLSRPNQLLGETLKQIEGKYELIFNSIPRDTVTVALTEENAVMQKLIKQGLQKIESGYDSLEELRSDAKSAYISRMKEQKEKLFYEIQNLEPKQLDEVVDSIFDNPLYADTTIVYEAAFTRTEKANVLTKALYKDLDHLQSMMLKRINNYTKQAWERDFKRLSAVYNNKEITKKEWKRILKVVGIVAAVAGVVSWAWAENKYGGEYDDVNGENQRTLDQIRSELQSRYNELETRLTNEEQQFLDQNGFQYTTCSTYEQQDSILCNGHAYRLFSGTKFCTVSCYKNLSTGQETLHEVPVCTSPFIPSNCYDPNEYHEGYADGYDDGYDFGYDEGSEDGYNDGFEDGSYDGYDDGYEYSYDVNYDIGYEDGYDDGYNSYFSSGKTMLTKSDSGKIVNQFYSKGYADGLKDSKIFLNLQK